MMGTTTSKQVWSYIDEMVANLTPEQLKAFEAAAEEKRMPQRITELREALLRCEAILKATEPKP